MQQCHLEVVLLLVVYSPCAAACLVTSCKCGCTTRLGHCSVAVDRRPTSCTVQSTVLLCAPCAVYKLVCRHTLWEGQIVQTII